MILEFYYLLFQIQVAVYGIILAVVFVFIQLIYGNFPHTKITSLLKSPSLALALFLSIISFLYTAVATLLLSIEDHDLIESIDFETIIFENNIFVASGRYPIFKTLFL